MCGKKTCYLVNTLFNDTKLLKSQSTFKTENYKI